MKEFFKNARILNLTVEKNLMIVSACLTINCIILTGFIWHLGNMTQLQNDSLKRIEKICVELKA